LTYDPVSNSNSALQFFAQGGVQHYPSLGEWLSSGNTVGGRGTFQLGTRMAVTLSGSEGYLPNYSFDFLPGVAQAPGQSFSSTDLAVDRRPAYTSLLSAGVTERFGTKSTLAVLYGISRANFINTSDPSFAYSSASATWTQQFSARSSAVLGYSLQRTDFANASDPSLDATTGSVRFVYRLSKYAGVHAGYARRLGEYNLLTGAQSNNIEDIDVGVDYNRPLTMSRKTILTMSSGSSVYTSYGERRLAMTGGANLDRTFGRSGRLSLSYRRAAGFIQGFVQPVLSDTAAAQTSARLGTRIQLASSLSYVVGDTNVERADQGYRAWNGSGRFSVVLAPRTTLNLDYLYYQYRVGEEFQLLRTTPGRQARQLLRLSMSFGLPIVQARVKPIAQSPAQREKK
jgi:hypothetical protein